MLNFIFMFQGMTQKDFATKICEKIQVVNEYENGKAVPNQVWMIHKSIFSLKTNFYFNCLNFLWFTTKICIFQ